MFIEDYVFVLTAGLVFCLVLSLATRAAAADYREEIPLWEDDAPGTEGRVNEEIVVNERVQKTHQPALTVHLPPHELATGAGVLICPGGGYHHLAIQKEGHQVADWLNTLGIAGFVLKYRPDARDRAVGVVPGFGPGGHAGVNPADDLAAFDRDEESLGIEIRLLLDHLDKAIRT